MPRHLLCNLIQLLFSRALSHPGLWAHGALGLCTSAMLSRFCSSNPPPLPYSPNRSMSARFPPSEQRFGLSGRAEGSSWCSLSLLPSWYSSWPVTRWPGDCVCTPNTLQGIESELMTEDLRVAPPIPESCGEGVFQRSVLDLCSPMGPRRLQCNLSP